MRSSFLVISNDSTVAEKIMNFDYQEFGFDCSGICSGAYDANENILGKGPDYVFIDMDNSGIRDVFSFTKELYQYFETIPQFIAISKTKLYAYEVIKCNFIDYLLKPLDNLELLKTFRKIKRNEKSGVNKICLKSNSDYKFLDLSDILYLQSDNNTTDFFLIDNQKISAFKTLKYFQNSLPSSFIRVHNRYIVNSKQVSRINFGKSRISIKSLNTKDFSIPFSRSYRSNVEHLREKLLYVYYLPMEN